MSGPSTSRQLQAWLGIWLLLVAALYGPLSGMPSPGPGFSVCGPSAPQTPGPVHDDSHCPLCCFQHHTAAPLPPVGYRQPSLTVARVDLPLWQKRAVTLARTDTPNQPRAPPTVV